MKRRDFLKKSTGAAVAYAFLPSSSRLLQMSKIPDLVVTKEGSPADLVKKAVDTLGGMSRFVKNGDVVVLKPNISWDRVPEQAATTNPEVVAEVIRLCLEAGAKKVQVFDRTLNEPRRCYKRSGIEEAAKAAGADVTHIYERKFKTTNFPEGEIIKSWELYGDVLEADRIINLPVAKHHSIGGMSLGMKNYMGFLGGNRGQFHRDFQVKIVDLNTRVKADLIILDAYRMLLRNGPSGGNLADVELKKTVVAGTDAVAIDSYGASMFGLQPERVAFLQEAYTRGLGQIDLKKLTIETISLS
ncbi:MAG: DUF362 domain-containing protein [bacterium]